MKCDNCGKEIKDLEAFCPRCGKQLVFGDIFPYEGNDRDQELTYAGYYDEDNVTEIIENPTLIKHPQNGYETNTDDSDATVMGEDPTLVEHPQKGYEANTNDPDATAMGEDPTLAEHPQKVYQSITNDPDATVMGSEEEVLNHRIEEVVLPVDSVKDKGKNPLMYIAIAVVVVFVIGLGIFALTRSGDDTGSTVNPGDRTVDLGSANIEDFVNFGHYEQDNNLENGKEPIEWKVLDKKDGRVLLLSKYGLDIKPYNEEYTDVTWETCTLRRWLNCSFFEEAFSTSEQSTIPTVTLSNPDNPNYGTEGGNDTQDQIFLLSLQEMQQYFNLSDTWTDYDGNHNSLMQRRCYREVNKLSQQGAGLRFCALFFHAGVVIMLSCGEGIK